MHIIIIFRKMNYLFRVFIATRGGIHLNPYTSPCPFRAERGQSWFLNIITFTRNHKKWSLPRIFSAKVTNLNSIHEKLQIEKFKNGRLNSLNPLHVSQLLWLRKHKTRTVLNHLWPVLMTFLCPFNLRKTKWYLNLIFSIWNSEIFKTKARIQDCWRDNFSFLS